MNATSLSLTATLSNLLLKDGKPFKLECQRFESALVRFEWGRVLIRMFSMHVSMSAVTIEWGRVQEGLWFITIGMVQLPLRKDALQFKSAESDLRNVNSA
ncbi:MAG: hypothetical protein SFW36_09820 [Leptolyngbyaceae cyanobacterium bins.59]|nr:hypothetical protein [Leptolyngbyaceae cyanobacterium bins.59]